MSCEQCKHYSELKEPRIRKDKDGREYSITGYCFRKKFQEDYHKGYAVFIPDAACKHFKGRTRQ